MKKLAAAILCLLSAATVLICGCGAEVPNPYFFNAMHADITVTAHGKTEADFKNFCLEVKQTLSLIEASVSATDQNSYISKFNRAAAGERVVIDECTYKILTLAKQAYEATNGFYNPAVYYSVQAFTKDKNTPFTPPAKEVTDKYKELADKFKDLELTRENGAYYAVKPNFTVKVNGEICSVKLDLGGIAKGYVATVIEGLFGKYGYESGNVNLGNSSVVCKSSKSGGAYTLGMTDPRSQTGENYLTTKIQNTNLSTSGDYRNYFIHDGVRYCHVIDPTTARPVQTGVYTATIIGGNATLNDAYTTALMAMGKDRAVEFINENLSSYQVYLVCKEGVVTNVPPSGYTLNKNSGYAVINQISEDGKIISGEQNVA